MSKRARVVMAMATMLALVAGSVAFGATEERDSNAAPRSAKQPQPNIVLLESDDQTQEEMRFMPRVQRLIGARGATFPDNVTNWPLCCPSRATLQTGQYAHNHHVLGNVGPIGGFRQLDTTETLPVWLQRAGYYTTHIGKFLNGYETSLVGVPPGWSEWHGSKTTYKYYGYQLLENGQINTYGNPAENPDAPADPASYSTDVYTDEAVDLIDRRAPGNKPFFLSVAYLAPHTGAPDSPPGEPPFRCQDTAKPAIRHAGAFADEPLPTPPNFNEPDATDKPDSIANRASLTAADIARVTRYYQCRAESLLAVDESVERIITALRATGELDNTLVIYTSDNGFFHGEHKIDSGKNRVYEEAIRVPLLIRGPGVPRGVTVGDSTINADLAPTMVDAAGATAGIPEDGVSLLPFAFHPDRAHGRELLIEQFSPEGEDGEPLGTQYSAVRTSRYKYVANATGEIELYDLRNDPFELENRHLDPAFAEAESALAARLAALRSCAGASCHSRPAMDLRLPREQRHGHLQRPCARAGDFVVGVRNRAQSRLVSVDFAAGGRSLGSDRTPPFRRRLSPKVLRQHPKPEIDATAELVDGRRLTLHRRVRICE